MPALSPDSPPVTGFSAPLIIGHRGSSAVAPENTMAAFARALRDGADGFEFDVRLSRDSVPVVIHDASLRRTAGMPGGVSDFNSLELKQVDVGSWFNQQQPEKAQPEYTKETVPTLEQVLDLAVRDDAILYLEMKHDENETEALAEAVVALIDQYSFAHRVIVESFNLSALKAVKSRNAAIRTAALFKPQLKRGPLRGQSAPCGGRPISLLNKTKAVELAVRAGVNELALHHSLAARRVTEKAADADLPVVVWTVDKPVWLKRALSRAIYALITNDPATMLSARRRLFGV